METNDYKQSPMMRQFYDLKKKHPDTVLLFRGGDFYETYEKDAKVASEVLGITLKWRNNLITHDYETYEGAMAGFPYHALDSYLPRLIRAGYRMAICDQLEEPKKLAKRSVTELVQPQNGFRDDTGAMRHTMTRMELETLYGKLEGFIADLTQQEYGVIREALDIVKTAIHKRIQEAV